MLFLNKIIGIIPIILLFLYMNLIQSLRKTASKTHFHFM